MKKNFRIALAGNPNCGKTCIFNQLTGARQHVGNYPGVTVESKSGSFRLGDMRIELIDLPGVYSLSSGSPEEEVVFNELTRPGIDLILNVIDSTIPQRSLYLTTQLAELHIPMLLAFNMSDDADRKGLKYDIPKLETYFGSPIARTVGCRGSEGIKALLSKLAFSLEHLADHGIPMLSYGTDIDDAVSAVAEKIDALQVAAYRHIPARFFAIKLLERDTAATRISAFRPVHAEVESQIMHLREKHAIDADTFMADRRYAMLAGACRDAITLTRERRMEISDQIDSVVTSKYLGLPLFLLIIYAAFYLTFTCAAPFMNWVEGFFRFASAALSAVWPDGTCPYLRSLVIDGALPGVGGVLVFLPNILFLFLIIAVLEDSGYMSRAAFVMDGLMRKFGLQGRSFVPLVLGFGCNVPAVLATRVIESERDRRITIMVLPLMSCGARLPVYAMIVPVFFSRYSATMMFAMYVIGVAVALTAAGILKSTLFRGEGGIYLMELPPYRMPSVKSLLLHMWDRGRMYLWKAGTVILFASVVMYLCNTLPVKHEFSRDYASEIAAAQASGMPEEERLATVRALENLRSAETLEYTVSGRLGRLLEPVFRPIGFDWKLTTAAVASLAAKEVFVSQLGILCATGEPDENSAPLREYIRVNYTPLQGFCIMLFCLLSIPCLATLAVIRQELNSWKWAAAEAGGLLVIAWTLTAAVYQIGSFFS